MPACWRARAHVHRARPGERAVRLTVHVTRVGPRVRGELRVNEAGGEAETRRVDGATCTEVVQVLSLTAALAINPDRQSPSAGGAGQAARRTALRSAHRHRLWPRRPRGAAPLRGRLQPRRWRRPLPPAAVGSRRHHPPRPGSVDSAPGPVAASGAPAVRRPDCRTSPPPTVALAPAPTVSCGAAARTGARRAAHGSVLRWSRRASSHHRWAWALRSGDAWRPRPGTGLTPSVTLAALYLPGDFFGSGDNLGIGWMALAATGCPGWTPGGRVRVEPCARLTVGALSVTDHSVNTPRSVDPLVGERRRARSA